MKFLSIQGKFIKQRKILNIHFKEKLKEILIEIFIIFFAVTLSIWLHNWSEHKHQQEEVTSFLTDLKADLSKDIENLTQKKRFLNDALRSYARIEKLTPEEADTTKNIDLQFHLSTLQLNNGNYEGFKSSGKISFIENKKLKKSILEYYQQALPELYDVAKYQNSNDLQTYEMIRSFEKPENKLFSDHAIRAKIILDAVIAQSLAKACDQTIAQASEILKEIDNELD
jgi:hypothetical protein